MNIAFAFWVFKYYGYKDVRLINGGRKKWLTEDRVEWNVLKRELFPKGKEMVDTAKVSEV